MNLLVVLALPSNGDTASVIEETLSKSYIRVRLCVCIPYMYVSVCVCVCVCVCIYIIIAYIHYECVTFVVEA